MWPNHIYLRNPNGKRNFLCSVLVIAEANIWAVERCPLFEVHTIGRE